jgi:DNA-directed RNA polymerases I, II, and III subunit RPABC2
MDIEEDIDIQNDSEIEESDNDDIVDNPNRSIKNTLNDDDLDLDDNDMDDIDLDDDIEIEANEIDDDVVVESGDEENMNNKNNKLVTNETLRNFNLSDSDTDSDDENYLQKFNEDIQTDIIEKYHPEMLHHNYEEINNLTTVVRNVDGVIIDPLHKTLPFITRYEKARVIGERAKQLNSGAIPMVEVEPSVIDGYLIAVKEFEEKKIPFIVKRPIPNGGCEYWKLSDLEILV